MQKDNVDNVDQKRAWEAEKDLLLKMQKDQQRSWKAEKARLLQIQEEPKRKLDQG